MGAACCTRSAVSNTQRAAAKKYNNPNADPAGEFDDEIDQNSMDDADAVKPYLATPEADGTPPEHSRKYFLKSPETKVIEEIRAERSPARSPQQHALSGILLKKSNVSHIVSSTHLGGSGRGSTVEAAIGSDALRGRLGAEYAVDEPAAMTSFMGLKGSPGTAASTVPGLRQDDPNTGSGDSSRTFVRRQSSVVKILLADESGAMESSSSFSRKESSTSGISPTRNLIGKDSDVEEEDF